MDDSNKVINKEEQTFPDVYRKPIVDILCGVRAMGVYFVLTGILIMFLPTIFSSLVDTFPTDKEVYIFSSMFGGGFLITGLLLPFIFKQNVYIASAIIFFLIPMGIGLIFSMIPDFDTVSCILISASIVIPLIILIIAKVKGKLHLYKRVKPKRILSREEILASCSKELQITNYPVEISTDNNSIIIAFENKKMNRNGKIFYRIILYKNHKYEELMGMASTTINESGIHYHSFHGIKLETEIVIDTNDQENNYSFDFDDIREPVRLYLEENGFKSI